MLGNIYQVLVFSAALLFFCWLLLEYLLNRRGREPEGGLYLASKTAFACTRFWKAVSDARNLPEEKLREETGSLRIGDDKSWDGTGQMRSEKEKESEVIQRRKFYRRQM